MDPSMDSSECRTLHILTMLEGLCYEICNLFMQEDACKTCLLRYIQVWAGLCPLLPEVHDQKLKQWMLLASLVAYSYDMKDKEKHKQLLTEVQLQGNQLNLPNEDITKCLMFLNTMIALAFYGEQDIRKARRHIQQNDVLYIDQMKYLMNHKTCATPPDELRLQNLQLSIISYIDSSLKKLGKPLIYSIFGRLTKCVAKKRSGDNENLMQKCVSTSTTNQKVDHNTTEGVGKLVDKKRNDISVEELDKSQDTDDVEQVLPSSQELSIETCSNKSLDQPRRDKTGASSGSLKRKRKRSVDIDSNDNNLPSKNVTVTVERLMDDYIAINKEKISNQFLVTSDGKINSPKKQTRTNVDIVVPPLPNSNESQNLVTPKKIIRSLNLGTPRKVTDLLDGIAEKRKTPVIQSPTKQERRIKIVNDSRTPESEVTSERFRNFRAAVNHHHHKSPSFILSPGKPSGEASPLRDLTDNRRRKTKGSVKKSRKISEPGYLEVITDRTELPVDNKNTSNKVSPVKRRHLRKEGRHRISDRTNVLEESVSWSSDEEEHVVHNPRRPNSPRTRFSHEEENFIIKGVMKFGAGNWAKILKHYNFNKCRTGVSIKDKYRNMKKHGVF